jgi:hypothetical protein
MRWLLLVAASVALVSAPVAAQPPTAYSCEVKNVYDLSMTGEVVQSFVSPGRRGDRFQIKADTGAMTAENPTFSSTGWAETSVLNSGTSLGQFLKVMYSSKPDGEFKNVGYLEIQGPFTQPSRPFLYYVAGSLYSGACRAADPEQVRTDD